MARAGTRSLSLATGTHTAAAATGPAGTHTAAAATGPAGTHTAAAATGPTGTTAAAATGTTAAFGQPVVAIVHNG
jgi:hypothetical protein